MSDVAMKFARCMGAEAAMHRDWPAFRAAVDPYIEIMESRASRDAVLRPGADDVDAVVADVDSKRPAAFSAEISSLAKELPDYGSFASEAARFIDLMGSAGRSRGTLGAMVDAVADMVSSLLGGGAAPRP